MKYLRVNPEQVSENSISYITIKEENSDITRLPVDWTLEFFVNIEISIDNNKDFFIFDFYTKDSNDIQQEVMSIKISKNDNNQLKFSLHDKFTVISSLLLNKKWNHIALVYAGETSLIVYVNSQAVLGINNPEEILTYYNKFDKFVFTTYRKTNIVNFTKIRLYEGILYNQNGFKIDYPSEPTEENKQLVQVILPPEDAEEDTILPIIKNASFVSNDNYESFQLDFKDKNFILNNSGTGFNFYYNNDSDILVNRSIGYSNDEWDETNNQLKLNEIPTNPSGLEIIDTEDKDIYYEMYDVKYQMPTVLKVTGDNLAIWKDFPYSGISFTNQINTYSHGNLMYIRTILNTTEFLINRTLFDPPQGINIDILTNASFTSEDNPLFAIFNLVSKYNDTDDTQEVAHAKFPINIKYDAINKKYTNPENIELLTSTINNINSGNQDLNTYNYNKKIEIREISNNNYNKNLDIKDQNGDAFHHFHLTLSDMYVGGKIDGADSYYETKANAFYNTRNTNEALGDYTGSNKYYPTYELSTNSNNYTNQKYGHQYNSSYKNVPYKSFLYLFKNKYYALFKISSPTIFPIVNNGSAHNFDSSIYLFNYPHNYEMNKGFNTTATTRLSVDSKYIYHGLKSILNNISKYKLFDDYGLNNYSNIFLYYPSFRHADISLQEYSCHPTIFANSKDLINQVFNMDCYDDPNISNGNRIGSIPSKKILYDLSPKNYYSVFVKEFDSTKDIGLITLGERKNIKTSFNFVNNKIENLGIDIETLNNKYLELEQYDNAIMDPPVTVVSTSYTRNRNILKFRNYYPLRCYYWTAGCNVYFHINDESDSTWHDIFCVSGLLGDGFVCLQIKADTGQIRILYNSYYPYSTNIPKMNQIISDHRTTYINSLYTIKKNNWNNIMFILGSYSNYNGNDEIKLSGLYLLINNNYIKITNRDELNNLINIHRLFLFMKSLNSSIVPMYTGISVIGSPYY